MVCLPSFDHEFYICWHQEAVILVFAVHSENISFKIEVQHDDLNFPDGRVTFSEGWSSHWNFYFLGHLVFWYAENLFQSYAGTVNDDIE